MNHPDAIIRLLDLKPHPEGGHYRETWRAAVRDGERAAGTAIYYLLREGEVSRWHRVDADEIWLWHDGGALELRQSTDGATVTRQVLGHDLAKGERPQIVVPKSVWQTAWPLDAWTLVSCAVSPAFQFEGFELAPEGWEPPSILP